MNALTAINAIHPIRSRAATAGNNANAGGANQTPSASHNGPRYRERDFGVGYGNSSGYASANAHRYAQTRFQPRFRCS